LAGKVHLEALSQILRLSMQQAPVLILLKVRQRKRFLKPAPKRHGMEHQQSGMHSALDSESSWVLMMIAMLSLILE